MYYLDNCRIRYESFLDKYLIGGSNSFRPIVLNNSAAAILYLVHLKYSEEQIVKLFQNKYKKNYDKEICMFIKRLVDKRILVTEKPEKQYVNFEKDKLVGHEYFFGIPDRVQLAITKSCNLRCKHCYVPGTSPCNNNNMTLKNIKKIIDRLSDLGVFVIQISGGEPLLHPDINEIIEYIYSKHMAIQLFTNATLLKDTLTKSSIKKVMEFIISIDGIEWFHDEFRGIQGAFSKTKTSVKNLINLGTNVKISYSLVEENKKFLTKTYYEFKELGVKSFVCSVPTPTGNARNFRYTIKQYHELFQIMSEFYDKNKTDKISVNYQGKVFNNLPDEFSCSAGKTFLYIDTDYNVYPCPFFAQEKFKLFNFFDKSNHKETWNNSDILLPFRKAMHSKTKGCENCQICNIWCRAINYNLTGKLDGIPTYCPKNKSV